MRILPLLFLAAVLAAVESGATPASSPETPAERPADKPAEKLADKPAEPVFTHYTIANDVARVVVSDNRGEIQRFELLKSRPIKLPRHLESLVAPIDQGENAPLPVLAAYFGRSGGHGSWIADPTSANAKPRLGLGRAVPWTVTESADRRSLVLTHEDAGRFRWQLTYTMDPLRPTVHAAMQVTNLGAAPATLAPQLAAIAGLHQDYPPNDLAYLKWFRHYNGVQGDLEAHGLPTAFFEQAGEPSDQRNVRRFAALAEVQPRSDTDFVGLKSQFFGVWWAPASNAGAAPAAPAAPAEGVEAAPSAPGVAPEAPGLPAAPVAAWNASVYNSIDRFGAHQPTLYIQWAPAELAPQAAHTWSYRLTGSGMTKPELALLTETEQRIEFTDGYYRFFKVLAKTLAWVLGLLQMVTVNYGVAVIALTFLVKLALHRTTYKQYESMMKMQKLMPEVKLLQEQYRNDKQKLAMKQMELWKKNGVNPLGGCLPILIQLPIFMALFAAFSNSADLRGASFLWVHDLTLPDQVIGWPIAFLGGWMLSINPLPLIYIAVTIWMSLNQKPVPGGDPQQEQMQKMMRWLPVIFGVIFYNMPSGLVLYFTVQAVLSTIEIKMVKKKLGMP